MRKPSCDLAAASPIVRPGGGCSSAVIIVPSATCTWMVMVLGGPSSQRSSSGLGVGHLQDAPTRVPEPSDVEKESAFDFLQGQLQSRPAVEVVIGQQIDVVVPHASLGPPAGS